MPLPKPAMVAGLIVCVALLEPAAAQNAEPYAGKTIEIYTGYSVGGGYDNVAGPTATVPGGYGNTATGATSLAAGGNNTASASGSRKGRRPIVAAAANVEIRLGG